MSVTEAIGTTLSPDDRQSLLEMAAEAIHHGLVFGTPPAVAAPDYPPPLREFRATFTTLEIEHKLRGCIGTLKAVRPLVIDVAHNSYGAAFRDPRFPPVTAEEIKRLSIHLSILNTPQPMAFTSEADLIAQLRPKIDGLILSEVVAPPGVGAGFLGVGLPGGAGAVQERRGTFLPTVWESLPDPKVFLSQLKRKAGLPPDYWSERIKVWRYTTEMVP